MSEGKVTLTCGHTHETPVNLWEPDIDRQGQRCRSYSTYCPDCAEDASLAMVKQIEEIEAENRGLRREIWNISVTDRIAALETENKRLREAVAEAIYMLDPEAEDILKGAGIYRIVSAYVAAGGVLPDDLKDALAQISTKKEKSDERPP